MQSRSGLKKCQKGAKVILKYSEVSNTGMERTSKYHVVPTFFAVLYAIIQVFSQGF